MVHHKIDEKTIEKHNVDKEEEWDPKIERKREIKNKGRKREKERNNVSAIPYVMLSNTKIYIIFT